MNWESGIFCKLYKTKNYKFNDPKYLSLNSKALLSLNTTINNQIKELRLDNPNLFEFNLNIRVNKNCSLYNLSPDNKNHYFSYLINFHYYLYNNIFSYGKQFLKPQTDLEKQLFKC